MKAILVREFVAPEVLKLEEIPTPQPAAGHALVRVNAAGVTCPSPKPCPDRSGPSGSAGGNREPSLRQGDRHPHTADRARSRRIRDG
jgi:hypothetical protein